jgi:hypothetical protein
VSRAQKYAVLGNPTVWFDTEAQAVAYAQTIAAANGSMPVEVAKLVDTVTVPVETPLVEAELNPQLTPLPLAPTAPAPAIGP